MMKVNCKRRGAAFDALPIKNVVNERVRKRKRKGEKKKAIETTDPQRRRRRPCQGRFDEGRLIVNVKVGCSRNLGEGGLALDIEALSKGDKKVKK